MIGKKPWKILPIIGFLPIMITRWYIPIITFSPWCIPLFTTSGNTNHLLCQNPGITVMASAGSSANASTGLTGRRMQGVLHERTDAELMILVLENIACEESIGNIYECKNVVW